MLTHLYVRNFAVIEETEVSFGPGLTVVTGETGAGKSLLVDALLLLSGARADSAMVRAGCERAELAAEFDLATLPAAREWLQQQELDDEDACRLRRVLKAEGSSRAWINGRPVSATQLAELAERLVEVHGQHEHQALLTRGHQLSMLDAFADAGELLEKVRTGALHWRELGARMRKLSGGDDRDARIALLRHEHEELTRWALAPDALAELEAEHKRMANAERLLEGANGVSELLDGDSDFALQRAIGRAHAELGRLSDLDPRLQPVAELLDTASIQMSEAADTLSRYAQDLDMDPDRYAQIDTQLGHLHELGRRHRLPLEQLAAKTDELGEELRELEGAGDALDRLATEREACERDWAKAADDLSKARKNAAKRLGSEVSRLMQELGMTGGRFAVQLEAIDGSEPNAQGHERCEFLVSANPGQPPRALRKVASGGELARISLAIEVAAMGLDGVGSMIFDEVDAGIGGAVAEVVGRKLRALGDTRQTLCVTHLPQVAAQGHAHLRVNKQSEDGHTHTHIDRLEANARRDELARMLGGIEITRETRAHAKKMLKTAGSGK